MKVAVVTSRFPYPLERGDKLRAYHQIRQLARHHEVELVALSEGPVPGEDLARLEPYARVRVVQRSRMASVLGTARAGLRGDPLQVGYFRNGDTEREVAAAIAEARPDRVYCQLLRTVFAAKYAPCPVAIDYQDAFAEAAARRAEHSALGVRQLFRWEAARIGRFERDTFAQFQGHFVISEQDRDLLRVPDPAAVTVLPNGVDTDFFNAQAVPVDHPRADIVFVGNLGYPPNVRAVGFLADEVLPMVRAQRPPTTLLLAGARPARSVTALAGDGVEVLGWVDDIRTAYARGRVLVAPLFIGAGQQNKILEAMAMGVPCVTTELVNNAIGAEPGREVLIASSPQEFAEATLALLGSAQLHGDVAAAARDFVARRYSWDAVGDRLAAALEAM